MIKRRFGDDFATAISTNLEIKAAEKKDAKGGNRRPRENKGDRPDRKPREPREEKKVEAVVPAAEEAPKAADEKEAPKRDGRRRGGREGQQ